MQWAFSKGNKCGEHTNSWKNLKGVPGEKYELLNIELVQMQWGLSKGNECSEHMNLWKKMKWVHIIILNIELTWAQWGLLKSNEHVQFANCGKNEKWLCSEQYEFFEYWISSNAVAYEFMKKFKVGWQWAIWTFEYWISLNAVRIIKHTNLWQNGSEWTNEW